MPPTALAATSARQSRASAIAAPLVQLDHVLLVLDAETYDAIGQSEFARTALGLERAASPVSADTSPVGHYLYGRHAYVELFAPHRAVGRAASAGIAFHVSETGASAHVVARLRHATGAPVDQGVRTRCTDGAEEPWFQWTRVRHHQPLSTLSTWVMEYADPPSRSARLGTLAAQRSSQHLLHDVSGATIALDATERLPLLRELAAYGFRTTHCTGRHVVEGAGVRLLITPPEDARRGVIAVRFSLRRAPSGARQHAFGSRSVLTLHDDLTATWTL